MFAFKYRPAESGQLQFPCVGDFTFVDGTDLARFHRDHGRRVSVQRGKLHFVGQAVAINVHDGPHVAGFQAFGANERGMARGEARPT